MEDALLVLLGGALSILGASMGQYLARRASTEDIRRAEDRALMELAAELLVYVDENYLRVAGAEALEDVDAIQDRALFLADAIGNHVDAMGTRVRVLYTSTLLHRDPEVRSLARRAHGAVLEADAHILTMGVDPALLRPEQVQAKVRSMYDAVDALICHLR